MTDKRPRNLAHFLDIKAVLDQVIESNQYPAEYRCPSTSQAHIFCHRSNRYRALLRQLDAEARNIPVEMGQTPYDMLVFKMERALPKHLQTSVWIDRVRPVGQLILGGVPTTVTVEDPDKLPDDFGIEIDFEDDE